MRLLFFHQNFPGQFRHLIRHFAAAGGHQVVFVTQKNKPSLPGVAKVEYEPHRKVTEGIHPYVAGGESAVINGQNVVRALLPLRQKGFRPDVMIGNPGWGETLFVKDVFPEAPLISYCEFYYRGRGSDVGFDPEFDGGFDAVIRARARAAYHLLALEAADLAYSPTHWQKAQFPAAYRDRIGVIHDGIDTDTVAPDPAARLDLPDGTALTAGDEVVTYVSRNLEPYRGFHTFMRALPGILDRRPAATVLVVGGDGVSYGGRPKGGGTWREVMEAEVGPLPDRVKFLGRVPYPTYLKVLQVSSAHIYLTYPFVLSWSMLEAMAAGCLVIGSDTAPVREVVTDGRNGLLTDFFDPAALAEMVSRALDDPEAAQAMRRAARATVVERYRLEDCLARQVALIEGAARNAK